MWTHLFPCSLSCGLDFRRLAQWNHYPPWITSYNLVVSLLSSRYLDCLMVNLPTVCPHPPPPWPFSHLQTTHLTLPETQLQGTESNLPPKKNTDLDIWMVHPGADSWGCVEEGTEENHAVEREGWGGCQRCKTEVHPTRTHVDSSWCWGLQCWRCFTPERRVHLFE